MATALILGATGGIGHEVARALHRHGWQINALHRDPGNYGPDAFPTLRENSLQQPLTRKGRIRVELERRLQNSGVRALIVRAGDYFGPNAGNNWFSQGLVKPGHPVTSISYPGRPGVGHAWAYLPDLAETMAQLLDRQSTLGQFERLHFEGQWDADGTHMTRAIRRVVGSSNIKIRAFPWALLTLLAPFETLFREMREMRYLWQEPLRLDNGHLIHVLGAEPRTPLDEAVRATLHGLKCLT